MTSTDINLERDDSYENKRKKNLHEYRQDIRMNRASREIREMDSEKIEAVCPQPVEENRVSEDKTSYYLLINDQVAGYSSDISSLLEIVTEYHLSIGLYGEILKKEIMSRKYMTFHDGTIEFDDDVIDMDTGKRFDMRIIDEKLLRYCQADSKMLSIIHAYSDNQ